MTKQARFQLVNISLPVAIQRAVNNSNFGDKFRQYQQGCITYKELEVALREAYTVSARLGKEEKPVKRFTPPLPAEYWREKKTLDREDRGRITSGVYHRSHVARFAGTRPA